MNECYLDYLAHYGVRGQKWGDRRFQNEDGTLTDEGRRHYGINEREYKQEVEREKYRRIFAEEKASGKSISTRRLNLENKYRGMGLSEDDARIKAYQREKAEKHLKLVAGVALGVAAAYGAYRGARWLNEARSRSVRSGAMIQRVSSNSDPNMNRPFYAAVRAGDKKKYRGMFGAQKIASGQGPVYSTEMQANKRIKIAGSHAGKKAYNRLLKTDPEFAANDAALRQKWSINAKAKNNYDNFNIRLVDHTPEGNEQARKFYAELRKEGYGGVLDVNDHRYSGYNAKKPIIFFNGDKDFRGKTTRKLGEHIINREYVQTMNGLARKAKAKNYAKLFAGFTTPFLGMSAALSSLGSLHTIAKTNRSARSIQSRNQQVIRDYKREHPNTKLTDKEILRNEMGWRR